jgi:hypothetical protein
LNKVVVEIDEAGWRELARDSGHRAELVAAADRFVVAPARARAPRLTGFGASTVHGEASLRPDGWEVNVSWSTAAGYMRHQQFGTRHLEANPFLIPTEGPQ